MTEPNATTKPAAGPVVVGVDGSIASERALLWAAEHAFRMQVGLRVVLVRTHPVPVTAVAPAPVWPWPVVHHRDEQGSLRPKMLTEIVSATIPAKFDDNVKVDVIDGDSASSIIKLPVSTGRPDRRRASWTRWIQKVVVGIGQRRSRDLRAMPVVITGKQQAWEPQSTIVVGVDGSPDSDRALAWAAHQAGLVGSRLHVVHAWEPPYAAGQLAGTMPFLAGDQAELAKHAQKILDDSIARSIPTDTSLTVTSAVARASRVRCSPRLRAATTRSYS